MNASPDAEVLESDATLELTTMFVAAVSMGDRDGLAGLLAPDVVHRVPGRGRLGGVHRGASAVSASLSTPAAAGTTVDGVSVTETMTDGRRALVVIEVAGRQSGGHPFVFETAFHLQTDGERIVGITEYSADQYLADELTARSDPARRRRLSWSRLMPRR